MYNFLDTGMPENLDRFFSKVAFFVLRKLVAGGKPISLYDYENDVIRPIGEPWVHFALNCIGISGPRLPGTPFTAAGLEAELERETVRFFSQAHNLNLEPDNRTGPTARSWISTRRTSYCRRRRWRPT
jgi:hypothetical protein